MCFTVQEVVSVIVQPVSNFLNIFPEESCFSAVEAVVPTDRTPPNRLSPVFSGISAQHRDTAVLRHRYRRSPRGEYYPDGYSVYPPPESKK